MNTLERIKDALDAGGTTAMETIQLLTPRLLRLIGVLWVVTCLIGLFAGPLVVLVGIFGLIGAAVGFVAAEIGIVLPAAVCAGLVMGTARFFRDVPPLTNLRVIAPPVRRLSLHKSAPDQTIACDAHCPVCATKLTRDIVLCAQCETPHHRDCWAYGGRCAIYGCAA